VVIYSLMWASNCFRASHRGEDFFFFYKFPNLFAICIHTLNTISKLCVEKRGRVEECSELLSKETRFFLCRLYLNECLCPLSWKLELTLK
jgi:hypothetical protein